MRWATAKSRTLLACLAALLLVLDCGAPGPVQVVGTGFGVGLYGTIVVGVATVRNPSSDLTAISVRVRLTALAPGSRRPVGSVAITVPALSPGEQTTVATPVAFLEGGRAGRVIATVTSVGAWAERRLPRLTASDVRIRGLRPGGTLDVAGRIANGGHRGLPPVQVSAVCYGRDGAVLGGGRGWTGGGVPAGGSAPVSIPSYVGGSPAYCRLFATPPIAG